MDMSLHQIPHLDTLKNYGIDITAETIEGSFEPGRVKLFHGRLPEERVFYNHHDISVPLAPKGISSIGMQKSRSLAWHTTFEEVLNFKNYEDMLQRLALAWEGERNAFTTTVLPKDTLVTWVEGRAKFQRVPVILSNGETITKTFKGGGIQ